MDDTDRIFIGTRMTRIERMTADEKPAAFNSGSKHFVRSKVVRTPQSGEMFIENGTPHFTPPSFEMLQPDDQR